ncbi:MAG: DUF5103 domain-containing protein [Saprospiraceae bacterium]
MLKSLLIVLFFNCLPLFMDGQEELEYKNKVYDPDIHSVQFGLSDPLLFPLLKLNSADRLILAFDDLSGYERNFFYKVIHCDRNWQPSNINEIDYINGFQDERLRKYNYSTNTRMNYIHYTQAIPSVDFKLKISGNYLLVIYEDNIDYPIITRRFVVSEDIANIGIEMIQSSQVEKLRQNQQIRPILLHKDLNIRNPLEDVELTIIQNQNWNTSITHKPNTFLNNKLVYTTQGMFEWPGIKEFREFDLRRIISLGRNIQHIERHYDSVTAKLVMENPRGNDAYIYRLDFNGLFTVDNLESAANDPSIISEYVYVTFRYTDPNSNYRKDLYILSSFNNFEPSNEYKLEYDSNTGVYSRTLLLKQGYYSYLIGEWKEDEGLMLSDTEGNWAGTENNYYAFAYYKAAGDIYDRVIAFSTFNTLATDYGTTD